MFWRKCIRNWPARHQRHQRGEARHEQQTLIAGWFQLNSFGVSGATNELFCCSRSATSTIGDDDDDADRNNQTKQLVGRVRATTCAPRRRRTITITFAAPLSDACRRPFGASELLAFSSPKSKTNFYFIFVSRWPVGGTSERRRWRCWATS